MDDVCQWMAQYGVPHHQLDAMQPQLVAGEPVHESPEVEDMPAGDAEQLARLLVNMSSETEDCREGNLGRHAHELLREVAPQPARGSEQPKAGYSPQPQHVASSQRGNTQAGTPRSGVDHNAQFPSHYDVMGQTSTPMHTDQSAQISPMYADQAAQHSLYMQSRSMQHMPSMQNQSFQTSMRNAPPNRSQANQTSLASPVHRKQSMQTAVQQAGSLFEQSTRMMTPAAQEQESPPQCGHAARVAKRKADAREAVIMAILAKTNQLLTDESQRAEKTAREVEEGMQAVREDKEAAKMERALAEAAAIRASENAQIAATLHESPRRESNSPVVQELLNEVRRERAHSENLKEKFSTLLAEFEKERYGRVTQDRMQREADNRVRDLEEHLRSAMAQLSNTKTTPNEDVMNMMKMLLQHLKPNVSSPASPGAGSPDQTSDPWKVAPIGPSGQAVHCIPQSDKKDAKSYSMPTPVPRDVSPTRQAVPTLVAYAPPVVPHPADVAASAAAHAAAARQMLHASPVPVYDVPPILPNQVAVPVAPVPIASLPAQHDMLRPAYDVTMPPPVHPLPPAVPLPLPLPPSPLQPNLSVGKPAFEAVRDAGLTPVDVAPLRSVDVIRCPMSPELLDTITHRPHQASVPCVVPVSAPQVPTSQTPVVNGKETSSEVSF